MMKYSVAVITGGTSVWPQMRMMRLNSRITIVAKPTRRARRMLAVIVTSA